KRAAQGGIDILFLGDSITQGMNTTLMSSIISPNAANFGISGDSTQHLLWRMQHGELAFPGKQPSVVVMLIGTNNLPDGQRTNAAEQHDVFLGIQANVLELRRKLPGTKVLILGILPREQSATHPIRGEIANINKEAATLADNQNIFFADITA